MDAVYDATIAVIAAGGRARAPGGGAGPCRGRRARTRQLSQEEKAARATYSVVNDGDVAQLERKLSDVLVNCPRPMSSRPAAARRIDSTRLRAAVRAGKGGPTRRRSAGTPPRADASAAADARP